MITHAARYWDARHPPAETRHQGLVAYRIQCAFAASHDYYLGVVRPLERTYICQSNAIDRRDFVLRRNDLRRHAVLPHPTQEMQGDQEIEFVEPVERHRCS